MMLMGSSGAMMMILTFVRIVDSGWGVGVELTRAASEVGRFEFARS